MKEKQYIGRWRHRLTKKNIEAIWVDKTGILSWTLKKRTTIKNLGLH